MAKNRYVPERPLTPALQAYFLRLVFPGFKIITARNKLKCMGPLQPSPTSDKYIVDLEYRVPDRPRVRVLKPQLRLAPGHTKLPHVFKDNDLCLYLTGQWRPDLKISEYIIPWISFWLFFYEVWLVTGEWLGAGHEPPRVKDEPI
jgi:hypothetical protein